MKKIYTKLTALCFLFAATTIQAQQLPDPHFESWGDSFNGDAQPTNWHGSNVDQAGFKFTFLYQKDGRSGKCVYVADKEVGVAALGITEVGPGYVSLGTPWQKLEGLSTSSATAGTYGGISFSYRPDSMVVWIKRTGDNTGDEDFNLLFYSWTGTAKGESYKNKGGSCTEADITNEESDVRISLDGNECKTSSSSTAKQVSEGWIRARAKYSNWTRMSVPIYYMSDDAPSMCNVIFSAGNYPNFRAKDGLHKGNDLYVDDVELIYSNKIQRLYIDNVLWGSFDPNSSDEQVYSLGEDATSVPSSIVAMRGCGNLTNSKGKTATFPGRRLGGSELTINKGGLGQITTLTVKDINGNSRVYKIRFVKEASKNTKLAAINVNGEAIATFSPNTFDYTIELPYDTAATPKVPVVDVLKGDDGQTIEITQATSINGTATIKVTAANTDYKATYTVKFKMADLKDNTLKDILIDGESLPGFVPSQTIYRVSLPLDAEAVPEVTAVSAYDKGSQHQTIVYNPPTDLSGKYTIDVTTPGNQVPKTYTLTFKKEASSYAKLKELHLIAPVDPLATVPRDSDYITNFSPDNMNYYVYLPLGTTELPEITWVQGDQYQTVDTILGGLDGTSMVKVTAASGAQMIYRLLVSTMKSDYSLLENLIVNGDGELSPAFSPTTYKYTYDVADRNAGVPTITYTPGDQFQNVDIVYGDLNETTRINVTAGDGSTTTYQILFRVAQSEIDYLNAIMVDGQLIEGFDKDVLEYTYILEKGAAIPTVTFERGETAKNAAGEYIQIVNERKITKLPDDYKLTVIAENGNKRTYVIHFRLNLSTDATLKSILVNGSELEGFDPQTLDYALILPPGSSMPKVTYEARDGQTVVPSKPNGVFTFDVTAEDGYTKLTYTVTVTIQKSENAFLENIRLISGTDTIDLPGFAKKTFDYIYTLETAIVPTIYPVKENEAQQVTVTAPVGAGVATIVVAPDKDSDETNVYTITFRKASEAAVLLDKIFKDGEVIDGWDPDTKEYWVTYSETLPVITYAAKTGQNVTQLSSKDKVTIIVEMAGETATYIVHFNQQVSGNALLNGIMLNGALVDGWNANKFDYSKTLSAGQAEPVITWQKGESGQTVVFGQQGAGVYQIVVLAANGTTSQTYTVTLQYEQFADATLDHIYQNGVEITDNFVNDVCDGGSVSEGQKLPTITYEKKAGQNVVVSDVTATQQRILVVAENGSYKEYIINYSLTHGDNVKLSGILVDGVAIPNFNPDVTTYTVKLDERTQQVPAITPQSNIVGQTYIISYGRVNARTTIEVQSKDKSQTGHYYVNFEVRSLTNIALQSLRVYNSVYDEQLDVTETEHEFVYDPSAGVPTVLYEAAEPEQRIEYTRKSGDDTEIKVIAQSGQSQTYKVHFTIAKPTVPNVLQSLTVNTVAQDLTAGDVFNVTLPYGTTELSIAYEKNYPGQAVIIYNGGVTKPTKIIVSANHPDVTDKVYTINPTVEPYSMEGKLTDLKFNGTTVPNFQPNVYNYVVNVTAQPESEEFAGTAYNNATVTKSSIDAKNKKITLTVASGKTYTVSWYYTNYAPPFDFNWVDTDPAYGYSKTLLGSMKKGSTLSSSGTKPQGWKVPADYSTGLDYDATVSNFSYQTGMEVLEAGQGALLSTCRSSSMNGSMPGVMTTGTLSLSWGVNGGSSLSTSEDAGLGFNFKNTPEQFAFDYSPRSTKGGINQWNAWVIVSDGSNKVKVPATGDYNTLKTWGTAIMDLNLSSIGTVSKANVMICASAISGTSFDCYGGSTVKTSSIIVQNLRFIYSSLVSSAKINGKTATVNNDNKTISVTLDQESSAFPILEVTGQVTDQEQVITWGNEVLSGNNMVRTGTLRNYGEDHSYTDYTLTTTRPAVTSAALASVKWGTETVNFTGNRFVKVKTAPIMAMPDVVITPQSVHQTVDVAHRNDSVIITVTPEKGDAQTYILCYKENSTADASIGITDAEGKTLNVTPAFNRDITDYTIATMPANFTISSELFQAVTMSYSADTTTFVVTASDKTTQKTYTIARATAETSANLINLKLDGVSKNIAAGGVAEVDMMPEVVLFARQDATDKITETIYTDSITLEVEGSSKTNRYKIVNKNQADHNAYLAGVLVEGDPFEEFSQTEMNQTITVDSVVDIQFLAGTQTQTLEISIINNRTAQALLTFAVRVIAKDGNENTYTFTLEAPKTADATLKGIVVGNDTISDFYADKLDYIYTLPVSMPKVNQPEIPAIRYITSDPQATVTVDPHPLEEANDITVKSADGKHTKFYHLTLVPQKSTYAQLDGIMVDGVLVPGFAADRFFYSVQVEPAEQHVIEVSCPDKFIDTTLTYVDKTVMIEVTAEDGIHSKSYFLDLYEAQKSNNATLANLLIYNDSTAAWEQVPGFDPMNNTYSIDFKDGATNLPDVRAVPMVNGQVITPKKEGLSIRVDVVAPNEIDRNTYTINFLQTLDDNTDLEMIQIGGKDLKNFDPKNYVYLHDLAIGDSLVPTVYAIPIDGQDDPTYRIDSANLRAEVTSHAQNGNTAVYTIVFNRTYSAADTLLAILYNNKTVDGFQPKKFDYHVSIPSTQQLPTIDEIDVEQADEWQTVIKTVVTSDERTRLYRIEVVAHNGHKNVYTVAFEKELLNIARLDGIKINGVPLQNFDPERLEYSYVLPANSTELPRITWDYEEAYNMTITPDFNQVDSIATKSLNKKAVITVTAENKRDFKIYTIHFPVEVSKDATLASIIYGRDNIVPNFFSSIADYTIELPLGTTNVPQITYVKKYNAQNVNQSYDPDNDWRVYVDVTAEDTTVTMRYTLDFVLAKSNNTLLKNIAFADSTVTLNFKPELRDYEVAIPYSAERDTAHHMIIIPVPAENGQTIDVDSARYGERFAVKFTVTAPNEEAASEYSIIYTYRRNPDASLKALALAGKAVEGFMSDTLEYYIEFPVGTDSTQYYTPEKVNYTLSDPLAKAAVKMDDSFTIYIVVTAQDTTSTCTYVIHQTTIKSDDNYLADLIIDGKSYRDFDPDVLDYIYYVPAGATAAPLVEAIARDPLAIVSIMPNGIDSLTIITCVAQNGKRRTYTILFTNSDIDGNQTPQPTDVIVKHIPGTNQILVASLRKAVAFALYDQAGRLAQFVESIEPADPNDAVVTVNANGQEMLVDVVSTASGTLIELSPNQIYFYTFFEAGETKVTSGKIIIVN